MTGKRRCRYRPGSRNGQRLARDDSERAISHRYRHVARCAGNARNDVPLGTGDEKPDGASNGDLRGWRNEVIVRLCTASVFDVEPNGPNGQRDRCAFDGVEGAHLHGRVLADGDRRGILERNLSQRLVLGDCVGVVAKHLRSGERLNGRIFTYAVADGSGYTTELFIRDGGVCRRIGHKHRQNRENSANAKRAINGSVRTS